MKTLSKSLPLMGPAVLLALFAAGVLAGRALALPLPAPLVGLAMVLLGLRFAVIAAALEEPAEPAAHTIEPAAPAGEPALRTANG